MHDETEDYGKPCLVRVQVGKHEYEWHEATVYRKLKVETFGGGEQRFCYEVIPAGSDSPVRVKFEDVRREATTSPAP